MFCPVILVVDQEVKIEPSAKGVYGKFYPVNSKKQPHCATGTLRHVRLRKHIYAKYEVIAVYIISVYVDVASVVVASVVVASVVVASVVVASVVVAFVVNCCCCCFCCCCC